MDSYDPPTAQDLRDDARVALKLVPIVRDERLKAMLLEAAREFLRKAAELEMLDAPRGRGTRS